MRKQLAGRIGGTLLIGSAIASGQTFRVLHSFSDPETMEPWGRMVSISNTLYGTAGGYVGGTPHYGSIFRIGIDGNGFSKLKQFPPGYGSAGTNTDGAVPNGGLVLGGDTLYGTTRLAGKFGMGLIFSVKTDGSGYAVLKHFSGSDGKWPNTELALDGNVLYGATGNGGASNKGAIFRINTDGSNFGLLKSFAGSEGWAPNALTVSDGVLYGTTYRGGTSNVGTVFSITTNGTGFTILREFTGADGAYPRYNVTINEGVIYGITEGKGDGSKSIVYKLDTDGLGFAVLKTFPMPDPIFGTNADGSMLRSGLLSAGRTLFGVAEKGGNFANGVVFALHMDDTNYTVLKHFSKPAPDWGTNSDGALPLPSLILAQGTIYGTTDYGGLGHGTLFGLGIAPRLDPRSSPDGFAFNVTGYTNEHVVIEASAAPGSASWVPLQTNAIPMSFVDVNWTNYDRRFYRARLQ